MSEVQPSGRVQFWDVRNQSWSFLTQRATERGIDWAATSLAELRATLALWEFLLPRDDPLLPVLVELVPITFAKMKERLNVTERTKCDILDKYIEASPRIPTSIGR
ncbi:hypothetical protein GGR51DRAFT_554227 [Nemania sp. FL0031]|nr:hypothetical protein GGR51DRAFT_554227 [Nemania sp. FL0031]